MESAGPLVSIIITTADQRQRCRRTLESVLDQAGLEAAEVLVVDAARERLAPFDRLGSQGVQVIRAPQNLHWGELRLLGLRQARGSLICFLEDHVLVEPGWLEATVAALERGKVAVGPVVENANPGTGISDSVHELHYGLWRPGVATGPMPLIPGNNSAYRRSALFEHEAKLPDLLLVDTVLQEVLKRSGARLHLDPSARLRHLNAVSLADALRSDWLYHRCYGVVRARIGGWSLLRKLVSVARSPLAPWARLIRQWRRQPMDPARGMGDLAVTILLHHAAVFGEVCGLLFGMGRAGLNFTRFELNYDRPSGPD